VISTDLLPGERQTLHRRFAKALNAIGDSTDPRTTTLLAHHWDQAHQWPEALEATVRAAEQALAAHGFVEAGGYWRRSLQLVELVNEEDTNLERLFLLERAAATAALAGEYLEAVALIEERIRAGIDEPGTAARLHQALAGYLEAAGKNRAALVASRKAVALHQETDSIGADSARSHASALNGLAHALLVTGQYGAARIEAERAVALAGESEDGTEMARAVATLGFSLAYLEDPDAGVTTLEKSLRIAEERGGPTDIARILVDLSAIYAGPLNQLEDALAMTRQAIERVTALGLERTYGAELRAVAANTLFRLGRWAEGDDELALGLALRPAGVQAIELRLARARLLIGRGQIDEAKDDLDALEVLLAESIGPRDRIPLLTLRAGIALWQGQIEAACESVLAGLELVDSDTDDLWLVAPLVWHGLRALGDEAEQQLSQQADGTGSLIDHARTVFLNWMELLAVRAAHAPATIAQWVQAYLELSEGEMSRARRAPDPDPWLRAATLWQALGHPYPTAYAWFHYADSTFWLRSRSAEAATALRRANTLASSLDARPLVALIETLARRARVSLDDPRPPEPIDAAAAHVEPAPSELDSLTERELVVLGEIAEGYSNREIAERLFISEKTVSAHISHILTKLGLRSRVQASAVYHRSIGRSQ
jgi:DNA-binding CsgD family transcriptional regulator/tetratricopeptide (TPR) repeat protein